MLHPTITRYIPWMAKKKRTTASILDKNRPGLLKRSTQDLIDKPNPIPGSPSSKTEGGSSSPTSSASDDTNTEAYEGPSKEGQDLTLDPSVIDDNWVQNQIVVVRSTFAAGMRETAQLVKHMPKSHKDAANAIALGVWNANIKFLSLIGNEKLPMRHLACRIEAMELNRLAIQHAEAMYGDLKHLRPERMKEPAIHIPTAGEAHRFG